MTVGEAIGELSNLDPDATLYDVRGNEIREITDLNDGYVEIL